jgi:hypothetical protein
MQSNWSRLVAAPHTCRVCGEPLPRPRDEAGKAPAQTGHTVISEQQSTQSRPMISGSFSRYRDFGRGAAGFGNW